MFRTPTVLVVGAGASFEAGLPIGSDLLASLAKSLKITFEYSRQKSGDERIENALRRYCLADTGNQGDGISLMNEHLHAGWRIGEASKEGLSIDAVIDQHEDPKVELMGKLGIVRAILLAERGSLLRHRKDYPDSIDLDACRGTWLPRLGRLLVEGRRISALDEIFENLTIITFNYDRCIEHYLPFSLVGHYGIGLPEARALVSKLRIYHPFGTVGRLPWLPGEAPSVDFGDADRADLVQISGQIRTFTEQMEDGPVLGEMRAAMERAHRIVFLGFAYHRQNLELIKPNAASGATSIFGTVKGISLDDRSVVHRQLASALQVGPEFIKLIDLSCADLFDQNWRSLTE